MPAKHAETCATTQENSEQVNVGADERLISKVVGGGLVLLGLDQRSLPGFMLAALGGAMLYRGITGNCQVYRALGIDTTQRDEPQTIDRLEPEEALAAG